MTADYTHDGTRILDPHGDLVIDLRHHDAHLAGIVADVLNDETARLRAELAQRDWQRYARHLDESGAWQRALCELEEAPAGIGDMTGYEVEGEA